MKKTISVLVSLAQMQDIKKHGNFRCVAVMYVGRGEYHPPDLLSRDGTGAVISEIRTGRVHMRLDPGDPEVKKLRLSPWFPGREDEWTESRKRRELVGAIAFVEEYFQDDPRFDQYLEAERLRLQQFDTLNAEYA